MFQLVWPQLCKNGNLKLNRWGRFNKLTDWALWYFIEWRHGLFFIQVLIQNAASEFQCIKAIVACHRLIQNFHLVSLPLSSGWTRPDVILTLTWQWQDMWLNYVNGLLTMDRLNGRDLQPESCRAYSVILVSLSEVRQTEWPLRSFRVLFRIFEKYCKNIIRFQVSRVPFSITQRSEIIDCDYFPSLNWYGR